MRLSEDEEEQAATVPKTSTSRGKESEFGPLIGTTSLSRADEERVAQAYCSPSKLSSSSAQAKRAMDLLGEFCRGNGGRLFTAEHRVTSNLSVLDGQPDEKAKLMVAFLTWCVRVKGRKTLSIIIRGLKDCFLRRVQKENYDVFEHPSVKAMGKEAKSQNLSEREQSAVVHSRIKQAVPHEFIEDQFALLHVFVSQGTSCLAGEDIWPVVLAAACIYGLLFACRISEFGASGAPGDEEDGEDMAHKHTLRCNETIFKLEDGTLVAAGLLGQDQMREKVVSINFLRRTAKMRANTLISQMVRMEASAESLDKYSNRDPFTGRITSSNLGPIENNILMDALVEMTKLARVQDKCMLFSRVYNGDLKEVTAREVNAHIKAGAKRYGLSANHYSSHSFKKGHVQMLQAGNWTEMQQQTSVGHKAAGSTSYYRSKLAEGPHSALFAAGGKRTVADNLAEQQLLDVGTKLRLIEEEAENKKKARAFE